MSLAVIHEKHGPKFMANAHYRPPCDALWIPGTVNYGCHHLTLQHYHVGHSVDQMRSYVAEILGFKESW